MKMKGDLGSKTANEKGLISRLVSVRRVSKVVKGGKNMSFSAAVVAGDGKGRVGFGICKSSEVPDAINKAFNVASSNMVKILLKSGRTVHHDISFKSGAVRILLRSAKKGSGIIAGKSMRAVFEALGMEDIVSKSFGSSNSHNLARVTIDALKEIQSPRVVANKRQKKVADVFSKPLHS
jgi:small subunit ribosomal protein S5